MWVKDETGNVGGSHKGRHLAGALLHLRAAEALGLAGPSRRPLAIASCGNAAIAAATLAQRSEWPLEVFVPDWADEHVLGLLASLGATVTPLPAAGERPAGRPGGAALPGGGAGRGDPVRRPGARQRPVPRRRAHDRLGAARDADVDLDRVVVQVGGGAFAACTGWGLGPGVRLDTVQAEGCAPLERAWRRAAERGVDRGRRSAPTGAS